MGYPLNDTFASAPAAGYTTVLGGMSASHNGAQQAIDASASITQSVLRFNEAANGDFWFEADVELLTDPSARKHLGLWMTTGNAAEGYRFAHLDGAWSVSGASWVQLRTARTDTSAAALPLQTLAPWQKRSKADFPRDSDHGTRARTDPPPRQPPRSF